ncbi:efflux RND transporter periplasmic adaptor subunit [Pseudomonas sp. 5P_3.1_Bac2]|uniref:efflux RND transporter periplasmic adaptor subunit n=1 Tax=Pseudomonas sp. 5P_3.1_Bac2 TaxID=2971617 RepID=UPI0021C99B59|nr:efflux RND transporter periplasmic adaptor subunit [Pseudomonas sp. 5P_3.1_Bac2]MCU1717368.1 efflux RND transporter periplasmic adaptor subunit [Pseudomonas sp. 5P_3.1_Bac2]
MQKKYSLTILLTLLVGFAAGAMFYFSQQAAAELGHQLANRDGAPALAGAAEAAEEAEQEGVIELSEEQIRSAGIVIATAQSAQLNSYLTLPGEVRFDEERTAHVLPPSAGVVAQVQVELGQPVKAGQVLATVASQQVSELRSELAAAGRRVELARTTFVREKQLWQEGISAEQDYLLAQQTLQEAQIALANARQKGQAISPAEDGKGGNLYSLRAPLDGIVVEKHLVPGEVVSEASAAFTVADMRRVWVTFNLAPQDLLKARIGQRVRISAPELKAQVEGQVSYLSNLLGEQTRSAIARVSIDNPQGLWRPGLFVSAGLLTDSRQAVVSVPGSAIQTIEDKPSVFVRSATGFVLRPVTIGQSSEGLVEVSSGLKAGEQVASSGSFILKSELGKGSAEHAH